MEMIGAEQTLDGQFALVPVPLQLSLQQLQQQLQQQPLLQLLQQLLLHQKVFQSESTANTKTQVYTLHNLT